LSGLPPQTGPDVPPPPDDEELPPDDVDDSPLLLSPHAARALAAAQSNPMDTRWDQEKWFVMLLPYLGHNDV
jgi:hypothetical protein